MKLGTRPGRNGTAQDLELSKTSEIPFCAHDITDWCHLGFLGAKEYKRQLLPGRVWKNAAGLELGLFLTCTLQVHLWRLESRRLVM